jgi:hypothetical protein
MEEDMSEFERVESVVRVVVGCPVSYLTFGILIASQWLFRATCRLIKRAVASSVSHGMTCPQMKK